MNSIQTPDNFINQNPSISILGCGWLGLPLGEFLAAKGYAVKGSTTSPEKLKKLQAVGIEPFLLSVHSGDIDGENTASFFDSELLIINIPPARRNPNVEQDHPAQIKTIFSHYQGYKIIFVSSTGVYPESGVVTEATPTAPTRKSAKAVAKAEQFLQELKNVELSILRLAGLVGGERQAGRFFAGKKDVSDPQKPVNMVHREDVIRVIYELIRQEKWNEIYNVCADEHPSKKAFYQAQARKLGLEIPEFVEAIGNQVYKTVSNEKVKRELSYTFIYDDPMQF
ncbi:MAG: SDR family oxidoreductase [Bacteroidota bacterium]